MSAITYRYIDPLTDFGFKYLFNRETEKDILIDFLNALFEGKKRIINLTSSSTEYGGDYRESKKVFFDLLCISETGEQFIVEMQRNPQRHFRDRCIFYLSRLVNEQIPRGKLHWNTALKEIYLIGILEFSLEEDKTGEYLHDIHLADKETKKSFSSNIGLKFLQLPNFNKTEDELSTELDKWLYLFKHMRTLQKRPENLDSPVFRKLFEIAELANLTKEEKMEYDSGLKAKYDYENTIAYAAEKAEMKGKIQGKLEGKLEGKIEGKLEGKLEGKIEGKLEGLIEGQNRTAVKIATEMLLDGFSTEKIASITKLPLKELQNLTYQTRS